MSAPNEADVRSAVLLLLAALRESGGRSLTVTGGDAGGSAEWALWLTDGKAESECLIKANETVQMLWDGPSREPTP